MRLPLSIAFAALMALAGEAVAQSAAPRAWDHGDYKLLVERTSGSDPFDQDLLTLRRGGQLLHAEVAAHIAFVSAADADSALPSVVSVTAPGAPDIVVQSFSGGAHCCFTIEILTLGDRFQASPPLDTRDAGAALVKLPGKEVYGFKSTDETYNYRFSSFVDSPHPEIVLAYDAENGFTLDIEAMRKPKMKPDEIKAAAAKVRQDAEAWKLPMDFLPGAYLEPILAMIYGGDMQGARQFATEAWLPGRAGLNSFLSDLFDCALPDSPWWPAVAELNGIKPYERGSQCKEAP